MLEGTKLHLTIRINVCKILQLWELIFAHFRCTLSAAFFSAVSVDFHLMNLIIAWKKNVERPIQCKVCSGKNGKKKFVDLRTEMVIEITFLGKFILNNWLHVSSLEWEHDYAIFICTSLVRSNWYFFWYKGVAFLFGEKKLFVDITDSNRIVKKMCRFLALSFRALTV